SSMRLLAVFLLVGTATAQQAQFQTKFQTIVSTYLGTNLGKACDLVAVDVLKLLPMANMTAHLMKEAIGLVPSTKYLSAIGMLSTYQSCLEKAGSNMEKAMTVVGGAFKLKMQPLYKKVMDKVKAMRTNGKTDAEIRPEGFKIATAGLTKLLIQGIINVCMTQSTKAEYDCALAPLKTIMQTSLYNMTYNPTIG
ncbi:hypothetical protein PMAYCL1PPCAC_15558, partial [Pristionchus mayeri]